MKNLLIFILIASPMYLVAQKLQTDVLINAGTNQKQGIRLDWTLGETVADVRKGFGGIMLMQGYQQIPCNNNLQTKVEIQNASCFGNTDGTILVKSDKLPMRVRLKEINQERTGTEAVFANLKAGNYTLSIVDNDSCALPTERQIFIDQPNDFKVNAGQDIRIKKGESVQLSVSGADSYRWSPAFGLSDTTSAQPTAKPTKTTTYIVRGFIKNCVRTDTLTVTVVDIDELLPEEVYFSPNGDGVNDTWKIRNIDQYPDAQIFIYNRWGQEIVRFSNYKNDWDGRYNGQLLPEGTYYFKIFVPSANKTFAGDINLIR